jgi:hypothetical protein
VPAAGADGDCVGWPGSPEAAVLLCLLSPHATDTIAVRAKIATALGQTDRLPDMCRTRGMMRLSITTTSPFSYEPEFLASGEVRRGFAARSSSWRPMIDSLVRGRSNPCGEPTRVVRYERMGVGETCRWRYVQRAHGVGCAFRLAPDITKTSASELTSRPGFRPPSWRMCRGAGAIRRGLRRGRRASFAARGAVPAR